jgi:hypothetical protein
MARFTLRNALAGTAVVLSLSMLAFGDIRIRFARGRTSATVTGRVAAGGRVCYFAGARRGQSLNATVSSASGKVTIFESGETSYNYDIETSGDQSICVDNLSKATNYTLTVSIR